MCCLSTTPVLPAALLILAHAAGPLRAAPVITEFMADNESVLADEDGAFSDWIEIHNPDATPANLDGWHLTDDAAEPSKWRIPAVVIEPGGFLVVFASGKDRRVATAELHTNFSLSRNGEYLALVKPDGTTVSQEFAPEFSPQDPDRSYGLAFDGVPLVGEGATAGYRVPSDATEDVTWMSTDFVPGTGWSQGKTGLGFGLQIPGLTIEDVQPGGTINSLATADTALASLSPSRRDVAVMPYLNFLDSGGDGHFPSGNLVFPGGGGDDFTVRATATIIIPEGQGGTWTFGMNSDDGGRIRVNGQDVMVDDTLHGPQDHFGTITLWAGAHALDAMFFERGGGAGMEVFAARGTHAAFNSSFQLIGDTANGGLAAFTTPDGTTGGSAFIRTDLEPVMRNTNAGVRIRIPFSVSDLGALESLALEMRFNDGFAAFLNGTAVASANAPSSTPAWNDRATASRAASDALVPESFNLTPHIGLLNPGPDNVLAIHGLNITAGDGSFLALPELKGGGLSTGDLFYFDTATPGSINAEPSALGKVADTKFEPNRGFCTSPIRVAVTTATEGAVIRYTLDGSTPTATTGTVYSAPIALDRTTTLRAAAFKTGYDPTDVDTHTYIFVDDVVTQSETAPGGWPAGTLNGQVFNYGMDPEIVNNADPAVGGPQRVRDALLAIPTMSIVTDQANLTDADTGIYTHPGKRGFAWERESHLELIFPPGYVDPDGNDDGFASPIGLRIRGGFSRSGNNPKHAFRLFFRGDYGNGRLNYRLFGREGASEFDKFDLRTSQNYSWAFGGDRRNSFMRDVWSRDLQLEMGHPATRGRFYHLYLNGLYWGIYQTDERAEAAYGETYFGGDQLDYDVVKSFGDVTDGNRDSYRRLWERWQAGFTSNAAYFEPQGRNPDGTPNPGFEKLLDVGNLIDYQIITYYTGDRDGPGSRFTQPRPNNYFGVYNRENPDGYKFFEHDSEHSLGTGENNMVTPFTSSTSLNDFNPHTLHEGLAANLEYRMLFADRVARHCFNGGLLTDASGIARLDRRASRIDEAIIAHSARWGDSKREPAYTRNDWLNAVDGVRAFIRGRVPTLVSQLRAVGWFPGPDPPVYSRHGGFVDSETELLITGGAGEIYFTVNGNDPRVVGGAIDGEARQFVGTTASRTLVGRGANWKYLDNGSNQRTAWRNPGFNDASWKSGPAQLGYGDNDEVTTVSFGPDSGNKFITTYFRKTFPVTEADRFTALTLQLVRDDGAVVYLNGTEVARPNMPGGTITYTTTAADIAGGAEESAFFSFDVPPGLLNEGVNTLAVEIHQANRTSSDISFDLELGGAVATAGEPLVLTTPGLNVVRSRVLDGSEWSAVTTATFLVDTDPATRGNLVISEIHYHPSSPTAAELQAGFNERSDFDFIELLNPSARHVDLAGLSFTSGIAFVFAEDNPFRILAPGGRVLLVKNRDGFEFRYGGGLPIAGEYSGNLSNDGEQLVLLGAAREILVDLTYNDAGAWPESADGAGYSLVLFDPVNPNDPAGWRSSVSVHGSPGASDATDYGSWKQANGITDDRSDDDGDGVAAILEYAIGGDPGAPSAHLLPVASVEALVVDFATADYLVVSVRRRAGADDLRTIVESSVDLETWFADSVYLGSMNNGDGTETLRFRVTDPFASSLREFVRGRFTVIPTNP